jgi:hypothetical protein
MKVIAKQNPPTHPKLSPAYPSGYRHSSSTYSTVNAPLLRPNGPSTGIHNSYQNVNLAAQLQLLA